MQRRLRLRKRADFRRMRQEGRVIRHSMLTLSYGENELAFNRYGFITPRHIGKAVQRNRIRRQLRAVARERHSSLRQGFDVIIIARPSILMKPFQQIQRTVVMLFERAGLVAKDTQS